PSATTRRAAPLPDLRTAVVTVVHGRHDHLRAQRRFLARCVPPPQQHVVVALDDPDVEGVLDGQPDLPTLLVRVDTTPGGLPVAAARNAGARTALDDGADLLVFLDVDCLPSPTLIGDYDVALARRPDTVVCGPVTYLPPTPPAGWDDAALREERAPHPARPDPSPGEFVPIGPALFWSLSFAVRPATWHALGGFYEGYVGYGGEDTDLGFRAADAGIDIVFVGGADAYHQHHPVTDPPVEHLDDIVRNAGIFRRRHGTLPMTGWLAAFREAGLLETDGPPHRRDAIRLLTVPARHPYLDAALPPTVTRVAVDRVRAWEPDPLLDAAAFEQAAAGVDVVHVHFSVEHLTVEALERWLEVLSRTGTPLVLTVHDLYNPHLADQSRHVEHLRLLAERAERVLTLTDAAAAQCASLLGRRADVVPHPTLLDEAPHRVERGRAVLVPLKALRANVLDPVRLVEAVADAAPRTRVLLDPAAAEHRDFPAVVALGQRPDVEVTLAGHRRHAEVVDDVARARALVLPYAFGTHSGWIELARDVGTPVVAPDHGAFADQWPEVRVYRNDVATGLDAQSLGVAVRAALAAETAPADRGTRLAQRDVVRATHEAVYRSVLDR
ncbi:galactosyltransferase-related protein, partial [Jatrophihabitans endophyticus]|uniref:glycosyltransferase n=1 Tax=Jatrophihabitans endophyticus TaxID=1206085 RepID=UPI0026EA3413